MKRFAGAVAAMLIALGAGAARAEGPAVDVAEARLRADENGRKVRIEVNLLRGPVRKELLERAGAFALEGAGAPPIVSVKADLQPGETHSSTVLIALQAEPAGALSLKIDIREEDPKYQATIPVKGTGSGPQTLEAVLHVTDPGLAETFDEPTYVRVRFSRPEPREKAVNPENYVLVDQAHPGRTVRASKVRGTGKGPRGAPPAEVYEVWLFGDFEREKDRYRLHAPFTGLEPVEVALAPGAEEPADEAPQGFSRVIRHVRKNSRVLLDVRPLQGTPAELAFDFRYSLNLHHGLSPLGGRQSLELGAEGTVSTDQDNDDVQNSVMLSASWSNLWIYDTGPFRRTPDALRPRVNAVGLRLEPGELECSQDFDLVNYTFKPQLVLSVPYSDLPVLMWHETAGVSAPFLPLTAAVGFVYSSELEDDEEAQSRERTSRVDLELVYNAPVLPDVELKFRGRWFWDLREEEEFRHVEVAAAYFLDRDHATAIFVKYVSGELPPTYQGGRALTVGFGLDF
jgi:hypothetical protein